MELTQRPAKCHIYICRRQAALAGYCSRHYESNITPYKYLNKRDLHGFIRCVQRMLEEGLGVSLPESLLSASPDNCSKEELRNHYRDTKRYLDTWIRPAALVHPNVVPYHDLLLGGELWQRWERVCMAAAEALFGNILVRPRLSNNAVPDIVPDDENVRKVTTASGAIRVLHAPVIVEVKQGLLYGRIRPKYGGYANRIELWFYRWRPRWRRPRERGVELVSPTELATRLAESGEPGLARVLRLLPILWRNYELLPHYLAGIASTGS